MRKTIIATIATLALSGPALAANDGVIGGAVGGAQVSSGAYASSSGNGSASTVTGGSQTAIHGFSGSSGASFIRREGEVNLGGVAGAHGNAYSHTKTTGSGVAGSGTNGKSFAVTGGNGYFDTHGKNPEGKADGFAKAFNRNEAGSASVYYGKAGKWNESGTTSTFRASASGNRDGHGTYRHPHVDTVATEAQATSDSYENGGSYRHGYSTRSGGADTYGAAGAKATAKVGNRYRHSLSR